tara:strand:- start:1428 stop:1592 length:165 start_codon:yes stop_codon:yes gene_type:complete
MYIHRDFGNSKQSFWYLFDEATLCDVAAERQVEITDQTVKVTIVDKAFYGSKRS